jgi:Cobalamin biosynthesis protein CobT (nicotinate-mononucleotide:5, 6-dimethylbenzimidazole phosphoribosyltransferase)
MNAIKRKWSGHEEEEEEEEGGGEQEEEGEEEEQGGEEGEDEEEEKEMKNSGHEEMFELEMKVLQVDISGREGFDEILKTNLAFSFSLVSSWVTFRVPSRAFGAKLWVLTR